MTSDLKKITRPYPRTFIKTWLIADIPYLTYKPQPQVITSSIAIYSSSKTSMQFIYRNILGNKTCIPRICISYMKIVYYHNNSKYRFRKLAWW